MPYAGLISEAGLEAGESQKLTADPGVEKKT